VRSVLFLALPHNSKIAQLVNNWTCPRFLPYAFYDWIERAQSDIRARGQEPVQLRVELTRAERAFPAKRFAFDADSARQPDPDDKILHDTDGLVNIVTTVVPPSAKPGNTVRVFLELEPNSKRQVHWTNDAGPTTIWVDNPVGESPTKPRAEKSLWKIDGANAATSHETRIVEFEARLPTELAESGELTGYVLYYVCVGESGTCLYRRQDIAVPLRADGEAP